MTNYYVYYRIDPVRLDTLRIEIERLLERIERQSGVRGRWMRRRDDPTTYMEVYEAVTENQEFESLLDREAATLGLQRRVERFVCA